MIHRTAQDHPFEGGLFLPKGCGNPIKHPFTLNNFPNAGEQGI
jgi:hypothetical protein